MKSMFTMKSISIAASTGLLAFILFSLFTWPKRAELDFSSISFSLDQNNKVDKVWLSSKKTPHLKNVFEQQTQLDPYLMLGREFLSVRQAFMPRTPEHRAKFIQAFEHFSGNVNIVHTLENETPFPHTPLPIVHSKNGVAFSDLDKVTHISWVDNAFFCGWIACIPSFSDYLCCLLILDRDLHILARLYHPGWILNTIVVQNDLFAVAVMNPREDPSSPYHSALFKIDLSRVLKMETSQVLPFSEKTIPSKDRRDYYSLLDIQTIAPKKYLIVEPGFGWDSILASIDEEGDPSCLRWDIRYGRNRLKCFILDFNLHPIRVAIIDQHLPADIPYEQIKKSMRLQEWTGDHWGPWITQEDINAQSR